MILYTHTSLTYPTKIFQKMSDNLIRSLARERKLTDVTRGRHVEQKTVKTKGIRDKQDDKIEGLTKIMEKLRGKK